MKNHKYLLQRIHIFCNIPWFIFFPKKLYSRFKFNFESKIVSVISDFWTPLYITKLAECVWLQELLLRKKWEEWKRDLWFVPPSREQIQSFTPTVSSAPQPQHISGRFFFLSRAPRRVSNAVNNSVGDSTLSCDWLLCLSRGT